MKESSVTISKGKIIGEGSEPTLSFRWFEGESSSSIEKVLQQQFVRRIFYDGGHVEQILEWIAVPTVTF